MSTNTPCVCTWYIARDSSNMDKNPTVLVASPKKDATAIETIWRLRGFELDNSFAIKRYTAKATVVINTRGGIVTNNQYCGGKTCPKVALGMMNSFKKDATPKNKPDSTAVDHLFSKKQKDKVTSKATTAIEKPMGKILIALSNIIATNIVANIIANFATL